MTEYLGKTRICSFCGQKYELDYYDNDRTHNLFCGGDCQYYGEVVPDYIRNTQGEERKRWEEDLRQGKIKYGLLKEER
jgi:hypothetical protein